jgi:hypothetical protein
MILQDRKAELSVSGRRPQTAEEIDENAPPLINVLSDLAGEMWTATRDSTARAVERHSHRNSHLAPVGRRVSEAIQPTTSSSTNTSTSSTTAVPSTSVAYDGASASDKNSPEFYIRKFMEADLRAVTPALADNLAVSLRTRPLE